MFVSREMVIPKKLQKMLPYRLKPSSLPIESDPGRMTRPSDASQPYWSHTRAVSRGPWRCCTLREDQLEKAGKMWEKKELAEVEKRREKKMKETRKKICRRLSRRDAKSRMRGRGGGKKDLVTEMTGVFKNYQMGCAHNFGPPCICAEGEWLMATLGLRGMGEEARRRRKALVCLKANH